MVGRARWNNILPVVFVMYTIAYFDRSNFGIALPYITRDLHLTATQAGLTAGVFAWGYSATQLIAGWLALKMGSRNVIGVALLLWGFGAMGTGLATNLWELAAMRVILGLFEGPVFAAAAILLSQWFMKQERGRAFGIWNLSSPVGAFLAGPISGFVLAHYDWRLMMVVEGLPAWIWAALWWWRIPKSPAAARWLAPAERDLVERANAEEQARFVPAKAPRWWAVLVDPIVLSSFAGFALHNLLINGFQVWLPSHLKTFPELSPFAIGLIAGLPFLVGIPGLYWVSWHSDRHGQERRLHAAIPMAATGALLIVAALIPPSLWWLQVALFVALGFPMKMHLPLVFARLVEIFPKEKAVPAVALVSALGNLFGGFVGPVLIGYLSQVTSGFTVPFIVLGVGSVLAGICVAAFRAGSERGSAPAVPGGTRALASVEPGTPSR
ncbi:MFS transporter [Lichenibacterium dinghuense]|uniref:MFS transporter n=1 Tax=Lichenibacterium dinghuense TaxID=2895977 RepID=UPI001F21438C|nr:MFS transporter [Lichenibacterium sp. 6Y81]